MASDKIIPFRFFDDRPFLRRIVADLVLRFDDRLSPEKLRNSFEQLLSVGKWRQLGGRIRLDATGKLQYHVPEQHDQKRPAFAYSCVEHNQKIREHPVAGQMPYAEASPHVFEVLDDRDNTFCDVGHPRRIEDWLNTDRPALSMHIVVFLDATLVTLTFPHVIADALGIVGIYQAWTAILNGRDNEIPPFVGFDEDLLGSLVENVPAAQGSGGSPRTVESVEHHVPPAEKGKTVQIPGSCIRKLKEQAMKDLYDQTGDRKLFVGESDVLYAWWARTHVSVVTPPPNQAITLFNVVNFRGHAEDLLSNDKVFVGNATAMCSTRLTCDQLLERPLWQVARQIRESLTELQTKEGILSIASGQKRYGTPTGDPPGNIGFPLALTNWNKAGFYKLDFGGAVVRNGPTLETKGAGQCCPSYFEIVTHDEGTALRGGGIVMGKDNNDNWWIDWYIQKELWPALERKISALAV